MRLTNTARVYFVDHNTKTTTWDDPRLPSSLDQNVPQYKRDFRRKLIYFRSQPALRILSGQCHVKVRRTHIFEDSYAEIMRQSPNDLKKRLMIKFDGEDGLDYGGLSREFFFLLSHEMFNPFYCLFEYSAHDNYTLQINPHSGINPEHLGYFKFIGRVVGLAIFHRRFLDAFFIGAFYKMILKKKVNLQDMEGVDAEFHRTLSWTLENDVTDVIYSTFSVEDERFGEKVTVDLKPGGRDIEVSNENKKEYVELITEWRIQKRVEEQFNAFVAGFHELIPADLVNVFDERELELLIGGIADIDVDDWKKHTDYRGYTENDAVIQNFWKVSLTRLGTVYGIDADNFLRSYAAGTRNRSLVCCNLQPVPLVFLSMVSKTCKDRMDRVGSRLKSLGRKPSYPSRILASTVSTCRHTSRMTRCRRNWSGRLRRPSASGRNRWGRGHLIRPMISESVHCHWQRLRP
jgi:E3 ubiquitin-protein ligase NEDD4